MQPLTPNAKRISLALFFSAAAAHIALSQPVPESNSGTNRYHFRQEHDRGGIGKFYLGREIAHVMGHEGADWLERPERQEEEQPGLLMSALRLKAGEAVADIGAG